jgi:FixJ family two-component response regulator
MRSKIRFLDYISFFSKFGYSVYQSGGIRTALSIFWTKHNYSMQNTKNPLIFVVEDNQMYNKLVVSYLKTNKLTNVESYFSGEEVLNNMPKNPDIIIQDYLLEGMTGIEVLIKAKKTNPNVEFIFLSGQDSIDIAINTMKYGAYDYIVKDQMALQKLVNKINKITSVSELVKSNKRYKIGVVLFFVGLSILVTATLVLALLYPRIFGL